MRIQSIYVDTSVIGGCFDPEFSLWSNGLIKDFIHGNFKLVLSELIATEISDAPKFVQEKYNEIISHCSLFLNVSKEALELVNAYLKRNILSENFHDDGLHIALATIAEVDILVSWNFKHIVHYDKIRLFNSANIELGYKPLQIYSPREVTHYEE